MCALLFSNAVYASSRDVIVEPISPGPYPVASTNFSIDQSFFETLISTGGDPNAFQRGFVANGSMRYVDELLAFPNDAFTFQLAVPDDAFLYGSQAGTIIPYAGYVFYPTSSGNTRTDYEFLSPPSLPRMQQNGELPIFADDDSKYPLLIFSHGAGSSPTGDKIDEMILLASHGYIVMALYHGDDRFDLMSSEHFNLRPLSISAAIDSLLADARFSQHIDPNRMGGWGQSFGGATMLALLGAQRQDIGLFAGVYPTVIDSRLRAGAGIVPYAGTGFYSFFGVSGIGTKDVSKPFMAHASNSDEISDFFKVEEAINNLTGTKYLIRYNGLPHSLSPGAVTDYISWIKLFFDVYVKEAFEAIVLLATVNSIAGGETEELVLDVTHATASFLDGKLIVMGISVGDEKFDVAFEIDNSDSTRFVLVGTSTSVAIDSAGSYSNLILTIPKLTVGQDSYSIELKLLNENPVIFGLTAYHKL
tara:strand:+ start:27 stop:1451 length:1425 start_codon:yes stop_codon:yes gene_type:complete